MRRSVINRHCAVWCVQGAKEFTISSVLLLFFAIYVLKRNRNMADCAAHEAEKVECHKGDAKCTKHVEEKHIEEVTEAGDAKVTETTETEKVEDASRKRKSEVPEITDEADGVDEAKKAKKDDTAEDTNGDKEENGKEAEEAPKELTHKKVEEVQRLAEEGEKEEVAA